VLLNKEAERTIAHSPTASYPSGMQ